MLEELLEINQLTEAELSEILGLTVLPRTKLSRKTIYLLANKGYKIPYFSRPICSRCDARFLPSQPYQALCNECLGTKSPQINLTIEDCLELKLIWEEANHYLHLTEDFKGSYLDHSIMSYGSNTQRNEKLKTKC